MTTNDLKTDLIQLIEQVQDQRILQAIYVLLAPRIEADFWDQLTAARRADIESGLADLEAGRKSNFQDVIDQYK